MESRLSVKSEKRENFAVIVAQLTRVVHPETKVSS